ncbi:MAG: hypothetical protein ACJAUP_001198 [Cellvibrionaceae bacterium]|jgi:hypothetical protein
MHLEAIKNKKGFLLPLALFMIVVSSGVALALLQKVSAPANYLTTSAMAKRSLFASKTGAELAAHQLFFPVSSPVADRQQMDNRCENLTVGPTFNVDRLIQCRLIISCECRYESGAVCDSGNNGNYNGSLGVENSFYRIESEASCGIYLSTTRLQKI